MLYYKAKQHEKHPWSFITRPLQWHIHIVALHPLFPAGSNRNKEMLVFEKGWKLKNSRKKHEARTIRNSNPDPLVGSKCSHHIAILLIILTSKFPSSSYYLYTSIKSSLVCFFSKLPACPRNEYFSILLAEGMCSTIKNSRLKLLLEATEILGDRHFVDHAIGKI